jgi:hypothetical protein
MAANDNSYIPHSFGGAGAPFDLSKYKRKRAAISLKLVLLLALGVAAGCATVKPYEREYLSRPSMDRSLEMTEARFYTHVLDAREGTTGGVGAAGGGCGCN